MLKRRPTKIDLSPEDINEIYTSRKMSEMKVRNSEKRRKDAGADVKDQKTMWSSIVGVDRRTAAQRIGMDEAD
eukprot:CAMPEP_0170173854 /NCGR_PEP_ID=MMETSP0040_2-20121228/7114_1 /TAXON_ID=641309 /ORGANISM="Lotharella oceanica, Strain CCMP622" /LENGTH=72 /DNA_ID=CAMNT_0010415233 /DNA_START=49 /DNA_END=267 /DNA_ORIENTATION=+